MGAQGIVGPPTHALPSQTQTLQTSRKASSPRGCSVSPSSSRCPEVSAIPEPLPQHPPCRCRPGVSLCPYRCHPLPTAPVVTGTGPNFSLGELQGHLAYDLNPSSTGMRRTLPSTSSSGWVPPGGAGAMPGPVQARLCGTAWARRVLQCAARLPALWGGWGEAGAVGCCTAALVPCSHLGTPARFGTPGLGNVVLKPDAALTSQNSFNTPVCGFGSPVLGFASRHHFLHPIMVSAPQCGFFTPVLCQHPAVGLHPNAVLHPSVVLPPSPPHCWVSHPRMGFALQCVFTPYQILAPQLWGSRRIPMGTARPSVTPGLGTVARGQDGLHVAASLGVTLLISQQPHSVAGDADLWLFSGANGTSLAPWRMTSTRAPAASITPRPTHPRVAAATGQRTWKGVSVGLPPVGLPCGTAGRGFPAQAVVLQGSGGALCWCSAMGPLGQRCCQPRTGTQTPYRCHGAAVGPPQLDTDPL